MQHGTTGTVSQLLQTVVNFTSMYCTSNSTNTVHPAPRFERQEKSRQLGRFSVLMTTISMQLGLGLRDRGLSMGSRASEVRGYQEILPMPIHGSSPY